MVHGRAQSKERMPHAHAPRQCHLSQCLPRHRTSRTVLLLLPSSRFPESGAWRRGVVFRPMVRLAIRAPVLEGPAHRLAWALSKRHGYCRRESTSPRCELCWGHLQMDTVLRRGGRQVEREEGQASARLRTERAVWTKPLRCLYLVTVIAHFP